MFRSDLKYLKFDHWILQKSCLSHSELLEQLRTKDGD